MSVHNNGNSPVYQNNTENADLRTTNSFENRTSDAAHDAFELYDKMASGNTKPINDHKFAILNNVKEWGITFVKFIKSMATATANFGSTIAPSPSQLISAISEKAASPSKILSSFNKTKPETPSSQNDSGSVSTSTPVPAEEVSKATPKDDPKEVGAKKQSLFYWDSQRLFNFFSPSVTDLLKASGNLPGDMATEMREKLRNQLEHAQSSQEMAKGTTNIQNNQQKMIEIKTEWQKLIQQFGSSDPDISENFPSGEEQSEDLKARMAQVDNSDSLAQLDGIIEERRNATNELNK